MMADHPLHNGYCDTALGQLHFRRAGSGAEAILLLPHSGRSGQMFTRLQRALAATFDVIAIDLPGSGQSTPLHAGTDFEQIAGAIAELCRALSVSGYHIYGIHTGNKIGASLAETGGARTFVCAGQTHSLVFDQTKRNQLIREIASAAYQDDADTGTSRLLDWVGALRHVQQIGLSPSAMADILYAGGYSAQMDEIVDHLLGWNARNDLYQSNFRFDLGACLSRIAIPTLVLEIATPAEDSRIGRQNPILVKKMKNAAAVVLEEADGIGFTMEHRASEIASIVRQFIASHGADAGV